MPVPKKFIHDRTVLLLISVNTFLAILGSILILLRLEPGRGSGYIAQYRPNLGVDTFKSGSASDLLSFIAFAVFVLIFHTALSAKAYHHRRHFAIAVLGLGLLLLVLSLVVSNALLVL